jgi:cell wall-associated NlpC family hydrolase
MAPRHVLAPLTAALVVSTTGAASAFAADGSPATAAQAKSTTIRTAATGHRTKRWRALNWAYTQRGKPYQWGGTGPRGYDCSGLVYAAYRHVGIAIPRTTSGMLRSRRLYRIRRPLPGDLAFYGSGHVELWAQPHMTFGASHSGTRIGSHRFSQWWHPTMYFRVRGAYRY